MLKYTTSATDKLADAVYVGAFAPVLIFHYVLSENFSRYWHYVCRSSAPLHPHQVFHYVSLANVPNVELIVSDGSSRRGNDYLTNIFLGTFLCRQENVPFHPLPGLSYKFNQYPMCLRA